MKPVEEAALNRDDQEQQESQQKNTLKGLHTLLDKSGEAADGKNIDGIWQKHMQDPTIFDNLVHKLNKMSPDFAENKDLSEEQKMVMLPKAMNEVLEDELKTAGLDKSVQGEFIDLKGEMMKEIGWNKDIESILGEYHKLATEFFGCIASAKGAQGTAVGKLGEMATKEQQTKEKQDKQTSLDKARALREKLGEEKQKAEKKRQETIEQGKEADVKEAQEAPKILKRELDGVFQ